MYCRSEVMEKAGQGQLKRSGGASRLGLCFKNVRFPSRLRENDSPSEAVGTGADNASVTPHLRFSLMSPLICQSLSRCKRCRPLDNSDLGGRFAPQRRGV